MSYDLIFVKSGALLYAPAFEVMEGDMVGYSVPLGETIHEVEKVIHAGITDEDLKDLPIVYPATRSYRIAWRGDQNE